MAKGKTDSTNVKQSARVTRLQAKAETEKKQAEVFMKKMDSHMRFKSEMASGTMAIDWLAEIEFACPYVDNIIRNPRLLLINEEDIVEIEKAKKVSVESVKDLAKHTHYIEKVDEVTNEVQPSKILIMRREETYNTYENRFIYTLILNLSRFLMTKEKLLEEYESKSDKTLEYIATTNTNDEKINIELKISAKELPKDQDGKDFEDEIAQIKARVKRVRDYINSWRRSELMTSLDRLHVSLVIPPIKKTNMILKNPNFQIAMKLWTFLQTYEEGNIGSKGGLDTTGDDILKGIMDDAFLLNYYVLDAINASKKQQREKLTKYAVVMINQQVKRVISLLLNSGIDISTDEILNMVSIELKSEQSRSLVGSHDVKRKFRNVMKEYLERMREFR